MKEAICKVLFILCILSHLVAQAEKIEVLDENGYTESKEIRLIPVNPYLQSLQNWDPVDLIGAEKDYSAGIVPFQRSKSAVVASVGIVPVLDQGSFGTCVTFAATAAMDMVLGAGDAIDQQCSLDLDKALGDDWWDGAYVPSSIIYPLKTYGSVRKGQCNAQYPSRYNSISLDEYKSRVDVSIKSSEVEYIYYPRISVEQVKAAIRKNHVVAIGFGLIANSDPISVQGFNVKVDGVVKSGGLWACAQKSSPSSVFCGSYSAGHEVVIVGYDDAQELFKIRNSWGAGSGDSGDYYMSYQFLPKMILDGTEIYKK